MLYINHKENLYMIKDGFLYLAALIFAAAVLVNLPKIFKGKKAQVFFNFAPPIVLIYLGLMLLCLSLIHI